MRSITTIGRGFCAWACAAGAKASDSSTSAMAERRVDGRWPGIPLLLLQVERAARLERLGVARIPHEPADAAAQGIERIVAEPREPVQLQLHEERARGLLRGSDELVGDDPQLPAVAAVLDARQ